MTGDRGVLHQSLAQEKPPPLPPFFAILQGYSWHSHTQAMPLTNQQHRAIESSRWQRQETPKAVDQGDQQTTEAADHGSSADKGIDADLTGTAWQCKYARLPCREVWA